jgi:beta-glucosidase
LSFKLKNAGSLAGDEVVQLYFQDEISSVTTYNKNLRNFERISLKSGETKSISFILNEHDLSLLDIDMKRIVEPGWFKIMVGSSSEDIRLSTRILL